MEHLSSPELAAKYLGKEAEYEQVVSVLNQLPESVRKPQLALYKLSILSEAAWKLEKKELDWDNREQKKYYPWISLLSGSASGFSFNGYGYDFSDSLVGSRLVFPSEEIAKYINKTYIDPYRDLMTLNN